MKFRTVEAPEIPVKRGRGRPPKSESLDTTPTLIKHGRVTEGPFPFHVAQKKVIDMAYDGPIGRVYDLVRES